MILISSLLKDSALLFVCGWYADVFTLSMPNCLYRALLISLQNSFPLSVRSCFGHEYRQIHCSNIALATVSAFLSLIGTSSASLENASVITKTYLCPSLDGLLTWNKSACTLWFGASGAGNGLSGSLFAFQFGGSFASWHVSHMRTKFSTSAAIPGHQ